MKRIVIFGNSGSGKSTLAKRFARDPAVHHLDLDTLAWETPGVRKEPSESGAALHAFVSDHEQWVIEGCYGSLLVEAMKMASEVLFLNPGVEACQENCRSRPWEPHKYPSKEAQDANLEMLLDWVAEYETRTDEFSLSAHQELFESIEGNKRVVTSNQEAREIAEEQMSQQNIRIYKPGDHHAIAVIFHRAIHEVASAAYSPEQCAAWSGMKPDAAHWETRYERKQPFVLEMDGKVVGFLELDSDGHIDCLYVHPDQGRKGIASRLIDHAVQVCKHAGVPRMYVEASILIKPLFQKKGFEVLGENQVEIQGICLTNFTMERILKCT